MNITLEESLKVIQGAKKEAVKIGVPMVVAVVDSGRNLVACQRMDDALLVSIDVAINKAYTTVAFKMTTAEVCKLGQPEAPLFGVHNADGGRIVIFGGGVPLVRDGRIIGGLGVSGGSVEQDIACAEAGLKKLPAKAK